MSLDAGGHLTHGFRPNISGKMFTQSSYGTDPETGLLDYDAVARAGAGVPAADPHGRLLAPTRARSTSPTMREIADEVGATLIVDMAHFAGLVAGKVFTGDFDPVPHAHVVTTTTHKSLRGPRGGMVLCQPEFADAVDRGCPMVLGGPLRHVMAAKAVAFAEARQPAFAGVRAGRRGQRRRPGRGAHAARRQAGHRRHRQPPRAARRQQLRAHRPAGRVRAARRRHRHQPQRRAGRPERRLVHLRRPRGHARADHPRVRRGRVRRGSPDSSPTSWPAPRPRRRRPGRRPSAKYTITDGLADRTRAAAAELLAAHPLYPGSTLAAESGTLGADTRTSSTGRHRHRVAGRSGRIPLLHSVGWTPR